MSRSRSWCFTLNNYTEEDVTALRVFYQAGSVRYLIIGREVGQEGTPHLQGYIVLHNARTLRGLKTILGDRYHLESSKGNSDQNYEYCSKDGDFEEHGERPVSKKKQGELERDRWFQARQLAWEGKFDEIDADIYLRYFFELESIRLIRSIAAIPQ